MPYESFLKDTKTQDAVSSRDHLIHGYFGVNLDIMWQIVHAELPRILTILGEGA